MISNYSNQIGQLLHTCIRAAQIEVKTMSQKAGEINITERQLHFGKSCKSLGSNKVQKAQIDATNELL